MKKFTTYLRQQQHQQQKQNNENGTININWMKRAPLLLLLLSLIVSVIIRYYYPSNLFYISSSLIHGLPQYNVINSFYNKLIHVTDKSNIIIISTKVNWIVMAYNIPRNVHITKTTPSSYFQNLHHSNEQRYHKTMILNQKLTMTMRRSLFSPSSSLLFSYSSKNIHSQFVGSYYRSNDISMLSSSSLLYNGGSTLWKTNTAYYYHSMNTIQQRHVPARIASWNLLSPKRLLQVHSSSINHNDVSIDDSLSSTHDMNDQNIQNNSSNDNISLKVDDNNGSHNNDNDSLQNTTSNNTDSNKPLLNMIPRKFVSFPFDYHEEVIVKIETLTNRGWGVGRIILSSEQLVKQQEIKKKQQQDKYSRTKNPNSKSNKMKVTTNNNNSSSASIEQDDDDDDDEESPTFYFNTNDNNNVDTSSPNDMNKKNIDLNSKTNLEDGTTTTDTTTTINDTNDSKKWVIMVPYVIPDELVRVRIYRNFPKYSFGDLIQVIESSIHRIDNPPCKYVTQQCGGCQYQHINISYQRQWKTLFVQNALQQYKINIDNNHNHIIVESCIGTDEIYSYRSKITPHYQAPSSSSSKNEKQQKSIIQAIGFQKVASRTIIDIESCMIATNSINEKYQQVRNELLLPSAKSTNNEQEQNDDNTKTKKRSKGATLLFRQANNNDSVDEVTTNHKAYITTIINGYSFLYQAGNFFQNNYYVLPIMIEHVMKHSIRPSITSSNTSNKMTHLIDCYCGSGLFAISLSQYFNKVIGIELNSKAIIEATYNAQYNNITNYEFISSTASDIFQYVTNYPINETVVILDPPRKGCSIEFIQQLYIYQPQRIVYMSCDPITQARDASILLSLSLSKDTTSSYHYEITSVQPFDLFPQTRHIECLMIFEKIIH